MERLKVAYLINQYPKVSHSFIRREIHALERQGAKVLRLASRGWDETLPDLADQHEQQRTRYLLRGGAGPLLWAQLAIGLGRPVAWWRALRLAVACSRRSERPLPVHLIYLAEACLALRWAEQEDITHVHAHFGTNPAEIAMLMHALGGPTYSFTVHGPEEFDKPQAIHLGEKLRRADFVVAISSFGRSQLYRWAASHHWPKIHVIHCGLELAFHDLAPVPPASAGRLVCVGRLCEQKGQLLLIEAVGRLAREGISVELVLVGDGEMRNQLEELIALLGLRSQVSITGWVSSDRVREEILRARSMVLPSFAEGLPVVIMEAMALRRPVLCTYVAGIPELVVHGEHGWLFPAGDIASLAEAIKQALQASLPLLQRMGEQARKRVLERHSVDTEAAKLRALFDTCGARAQELS